MNAKSPAVEEHLGLVYANARRFGRSVGIAEAGVEYDDIVQEGALGLVEAARRFEPSRGNAFSTYATYRIRGRISDALRRHWRGKRWIVPILEKPDGSPDEPPPTAPAVVFLHEEVARYGTDLRDAYARLPEEERAALAGQIVGERYPEAAKRLGVSRATVRRRRMRALSTLRTALNVHVNSAHGRVTSGHPATLRKSKGDSR